MTTALLAISLLTNLTVEGVKKLLDESGKTYSSNVLAAILSCGVCVVYLVMNDISFSVKIGIEIVVLMYLGFLVSTLGYDKIIQMLKQIQSAKEGTTHEQ
jgi:hypothetical protein